MDVATDRIPASADVKEVVFEILGVVDYDNDEFAVLIENSANADEVVIFKIQSLSLIHISEATHVCGFIRIAESIPTLYLFS